jgi:hypothetical protein
MLSSILSSKIMLSVTSVHIIMTVIRHSIFILLFCRVSFCSTCRDALCNYAEYNFAKQHYAITLEHNDCHCADIILLSVIMLSVTFKPVVLSVFMVSATF